MGAARATVDLRGIVTAWNQEAQQLLGYGSGEVVGRPAVDLLCEGVSEAELRSAAARGRWRGQAALRHRDGSRLEVGLLAHRREAAPAVEEWLLVTPLQGTEPHPQDDELTAWAFRQSPCAAVVYDTDLRLRRANAIDEQLVDLTEEEMRGLRLVDFLPYPESEVMEAHMRLALQTGERQQVELYWRAPGQSRAHAWSILLAPLKDEAAQVRGACLVALDTTEAYEARQRLLLLSDAGARIGRTLDVTHTAEDLVAVAVPCLADLVTVGLLTCLDSGIDPPPSPYRGPVDLRRIAHGSVLEGCPESVVALGGLDPCLPSSPSARCLAAGRAVRYELSESALAQWAIERPQRVAQVRRYGIHSAMAVPLLARGAVLGVVLLARHRRPEPFTEDDVMLAEELAARAAVCIDNARRYTRERNASLTLQRSLLPPDLPRRTALECASRYLPAAGQPGVGGDWFDVIPLPGARVALVVGDVVGHGVHASAAMGRLRTTIRALADVDLAPDELLTRLDDLVIHLSDEAEDAGDLESAAGTAGAIGASCLYAVYDPISGHCTLARAGHPLPLVVTPDGTADLLELPAGPPLGLGGLPFESIEVELAAGSLLALYTDGLLGTGSPDQALQAMREVLARREPSLSILCDTVLQSVLHDRPADDDVALLLARTHTLGADQVATWQLAADPAVVAQARKHTAEQLTTWGLHEAVFTTELVVSELVTNAIRYGCPPIQLRLIRERSLICEVSDGSNTAPHLRRARVFDEGGRGLLLVAQLTQRWGTRQTHAGKTIWAEQDLAVVSADQDPAL
ncbi:SpoIIE family protein phosphatase [Peterkaempfera sp. SMS 1(5)a]